MSLTGKPTVVEPRAASSVDPVPALRPTQSAIASIRERLRLIETEINGLSTRVAGTSGMTDIASLQQQIRALRTRIEALEGASPTQWHVNGSLVGANHRVDFRSTGGIVITGQVDPVQNRVVISFQPVLIMPIQRANLVLGGREIGMSLASLQIDVTRGRIQLGGRSLNVSGGQQNMPVGRASIVLAGMDVSLSVGSAGISVDMGRIVLVPRSVQIAWTENFSAGLWNQTIYGTFEPGHPTVISGGLAFTNLSGGGGGSLSPTDSPALFDIDLSLDLRSDAATNAFSSWVAWRTPGSSLTITATACNFSVSFDQTGTVTIRAGSIVLASGPWHTPGTPSTVHVRHIGSQLDVWIDGTNRYSGTQSGGSAARILLGSNSSPLATGRVNRADNVSVASP